MKLKTTFTTLTLVLYLSLSAIGNTYASNGFEGSRLRSLAQSICGFYSAAGADFQSSFEKVVTDDMHINDGISNPTPKQKVDFLNRHKQMMTCGSGERKKHYMMEAFNRSAHIALFQDIFRRNYIAKDRSARIDVNVVSYSGLNGQPESLLDYMDRILTDKSNDAYYLKEVAKLKKYFIKKLGAKHFKDLPASEQAKFKH